MIETRDEMLARRGSLKADQPGTLALREPNIQESSAEFHVLEVRQGGVTAYLSLKELEELNRVLQSSGNNHLRAGVQAAIFAARYGLQ